jgi:hypothetical protein
MKPCSRCGKRPRIEGLGICDPCVSAAAEARQKEAEVARSIRLDLAKTTAKTIGLPQDLYKWPIRERRGRKELRVFLEDDESGSDIE